MQRVRYNSPLALVIDDELEDTVSIRYTEGDRVLASLAWDRRQRSADVRVEHGKLELHVLDARVRLPGVLGGVELRDVHTEDL